MMKGEVLRYFREKKGWKQKQLAEALSEFIPGGVTSQAISLYELNQRRIPMDLIPELAQLLEFQVVISSQGTLFLSAQDPYHFRSLDPEEQVTLLLEEYFQQLEQVPSLSFEEFESDLCQLLLGQLDLEYTMFAFEPTYGDEEDRMISPAFRLIGSDYQTLKELEALLQDPQAFGQLRLELDTEVGEVIVEISFEIMNPTTFQQLGQEVLKRLPWEWNQGEKELENGKYRFPQALSEDVNVMARTLIHPASFQVWVR